MLVIGCLGLPQAFLKQTLLSGQVGLGESAAHKGPAGHSYVGVLGPIGCIGFHLPRHDPPILYGLVMGCWMDAETPLGLAGVEL